MEFAVILFGRLLPRIAEYLLNGSPREVKFHKDVNKSGDTLVKKCCHFFDLFCLITGQEMDSCVSKVHGAIKITRTRR
jgi:hypothetical protein